MAVSPRARYLANGDLELHFPYDYLLVDALKTEFPSYARRYNPDDKTWTVSQPYVAHAESLLRWRFPEARIERPDTDGRFRPEQPFAVLHLLPTAPPELIDGAYRILARLHHPDRGGETERMRELNEARGALRQWGKR